jgi:hypothetical protein
MVEAIKIQFAGSDVLKGYFVSRLFNPYAKYNGFDTKQPMLLGDIDELTVYLEVHFLLYNLRYGNGGVFTDHVIAYQHFPDQSFHCFTR